MTNEELRTKVVEIMSKTWEEPVPCTAERNFERIADALIAAGIGDIREAEHRAEVYYEALLSAAAYGDTPPDYYIKQAEKELEGKNE